MKVRFGDEVAIGEDLVIAARRLSYGRASIILRRGDASPRDTLSDALDIEPGIAVRVCVDMNRAKLAIDAPDHVLIQRLDHNVLPPTSQRTQDVVVKR